MKRENLLLGIIVRQKKPERRPKQNGQQANLQNIQKQDAHPAAKPSPKPEPPRQKVDPRLRNKKR